MIEDTITDLNDQLESPMVASPPLWETSNIQDMVSREIRSIERCLRICNEASTFITTIDLQVRKVQLTVVSSINELLPEERQGLT